MDATRIQRAADLPPQVAQAAAAFDIHGHGLGAASGSPGPASATEDSSTESARKFRSYAARKLWASLPLLRQATSRAKLPCFSVFATTCAFGGWPRWPSPPWGQAYILTSFARAGRPREQPRVQISPASSSAWSRRPQVCSLRWPRRRRCHALVLLANAPAAGLKGRVSDVNAGQSGDGGLQFLGAPRAAPLPLVAAPGDATLTHLPCSLG